MKYSKNITIVQPFIAHYREDFFLTLSEIHPLNLVCVRRPNVKDGFNERNNLNIKWLKSINIGSLNLFNPFSSLLNKNKTIVIMWDPRWIGLYLMLLFKIVTKRKIIIWTHGISIKKGFNSESIKDRIKVFFFNFADGICFYTENELNILSPHLNKPKLFYINNTLNVEKIISLFSSLNLNKKDIKKKYGICAKRVIVYCARFIKHRRPDILIELIELMAKEDVKFIIIGDGSFKPDFSQYNIVQDFGALYDEKIKAELFSIADFSFQPAWTGLSVVESFAHGVPYITLKKAHDIHQCVEYNYIIHGFNGFIANNIKSVQETIRNFPETELDKMKKYCIDYVKNNLSLSKMVANFTNGIVNSTFYK